MEFSFLLVGGALFYEKVHGRALETPIPKIEKNIFLYLILLLGGMY
jgi:hypothetical protein